MHPRFPVVLALVLWFFGFAAAAGEGQPITADPRVREVITMVQGGLSAAVILAKVDDLGAFPELTAQDLVTLKGRGVPEQVLVRMVELREAAPLAPALAAPAAVEARPLASEVAEAPSALLRVEIERGFPVTYYEVAVDGEVVATAGRLWQGESRPGEKLQRPSRVREGERFLALELEVSPGEHEVAVGFSVTSVEDSADNLTDPWSSTAVEHYLNRGVRAVSAPEDAVPGEWSAATATRCTATPDAPCTVVASFERQAPTPLGGLPVYGVRYR